TDLPFAGSRIPASQLDPAAQHLLSLFPLPNQPGERQNFHFVTTTTSRLDDVNIRIVHSFAAPSSRGGEPGSPQPQVEPGGARGAFGGGRRAVTATSNLNATVHYRHSDTGTLNPFPTVGGAN